MLTAVAPTPARKSRIVLLKTRTFLPLKPSSPLTTSLHQNTCGVLPPKASSLRVPVLLHLPVDHGAIGIARRARLVGIERQAGEVAGLEARVVAGHLGDVHAGEIHHAELQQPQHGLVVDAHLVERRDVGGDRALRRLGDRLAPERHLVMDRRRRRAVQPDDLELALRQILRESSGCERPCQRRSCPKLSKHRFLPRPARQRPILALECVTSQGRIARESRQRVFPGASA